MRSLFAVLAATLLLNCSPGSNCKSRPFTPSGNASADIVGTWSSFGVDTPVYGTFSADGGFTSLGLTGSWSIPDAGQLTWNGKTSALTFEDGGVRFDDAAPARLHSAVTCTTTN